jgi:hypothetical protein
MTTSRHSVLPIFPSSNETQQPTPLLLLLLLPNISGE